MAPRHTIVFELQSNLIEGHIFLLSSFPLVATDFLTDSFMATHKNLYFDRYVQTSRDYFYRKSHFHFSKNIFELCV